CITKFTRDETLTQQRSMSVTYNVTPKTVVSLRYDFTGTLSVYGNTPSLVNFAPPPGYTGKYASGAFSFYTEGTGSIGVPARELDQNYEWDIRSQLGRGSARLSYDS